MNGREAKRLRREARKLAEPHHTTFVMQELKNFFNSLSWRDRARAAWRLLRGKF